MSRLLFHRCSSRREEAPIHLRFTIYDLRFQFEPRYLGCCAILVAALVCFAQTSGAATNDFFAQGVELSRAGQFPEAAAAFEKSAQMQPTAGTLVNLGIAEWRRGHAGAAILAWEQAQWIDPFDPRAGADLKFARQAAQLDAPQLKWFETASTWLPPNAWAWLAGASLWLAVGLMMLPGILRRRKAGWQQALAALAFGIFLFCITANLGVVSRTQTGFVLKKNAAAAADADAGGGSGFDIERGRAGAPVADAGKLFLHPHGVRGGLDQPGAVRPGLSRTARRRGGGPAGTG